jgi:hypothetical protein
MRTLSDFHRLKALIGAADQAWPNFDTIQNKVF